MQKVIQRLNREGEKGERTLTEGNYIFVKSELKGKFFKINHDDIEYAEGMKN